MLFRQVWHISNSLIVVYSLACWLWFDVIKEWIIGWRGRGCVYSECKKLGKCGQLSHPIPFFVSDCDLKCLVCFLLA